MKRECMFYAVELGMNLEKMKEHGKKAISEKGYISMKKHDLTNDTKELINTIKNMVNNECIKITINENDILVDMITAISGNDADKLHSSARDLENVLLSYYKTYIKE